jgi:hypothetical protein
LNGVECRRYGPRDFMSLLRLRPTERISSSVSRGPARGVHSNPGSALSANQQLNMLFDSLTDVAMLEAVSNGVAFAALGLLLVICLNGVKRAMKFPPSLIVIAVIAIAVGLMRLPLIPVILAVAPISVAFAWRRI